MNNVSLDRRNLLRGALLVMLGATLAACGVKGRPEPPAGDAAAYPRSYPKSNRYPAPAEGEDERIDPATGEELDPEDLETVEEEDDDL